MNDTASGFAPENLDEDMEHVVELVMKRLKEASDPEKAESV